MAILKIARMGHPVLLQRAEPVNPAQGPSVHQLIADMLKTLSDAGGVGLAAPQVHEAVRIIMFFVPEDRAAPDSEERSVPLTVLINPEVEPVGSDTELGWEGCLSIPGLQGLVPRYRTIRYRGLAPDGTMIEREATGFHARVVQHEADHLDGILYPMRMPDLSRLAFNEEWRRFVAERKELTEK